ncbi:MAG TPA: protein kinase [Vicinamibacterales bacterium]|nr:protein kinase [Vicinamibacterales bacterium]
MIGSTAGSYQFLSKLGEGGMGEVYRARDLKLGRIVAIKVLPDALAGDPERIARFEREARALAALNHPNVATLYGLETVPSGTHGHLLVMELVEGETLADRLARGPIPLEEAVTLARQIAEGLEAAHERGIVHRDLKPANIKITPDGQVKLLDFGLAKAMESDGGPDPRGNLDLANSPTFTRLRQGFGAAGPRQGFGAAGSRQGGGGADAGYADPGLGTAVGVIMGTAAYMSPEQARGFPADHRSDIFSFGIVLYEMLTARRLFDGDTLSDILAGVIARDPDLSGLDPMWNPRLPDLIRRCLAKSPKKRWQAIGDARAELEIIAAAPRVSPAIPTAAAHAPRWRRALPLAALGVALIAVAGLVWRGRPAAPADAVTRFSIVLADGQQFGGTQRSVLALSHDGRLLAFTAGPPRNLWVRPMDALDVHPVKGSEGDAWPTGPVFSPDDLSLAYWNPADQTIDRVPVAGGAPLTLCATELPSGMTWSASGLVFANTEGIFRVADGGGQPDLLIKGTPGELAFEPQLLPDGRTVLFTTADAVGGSERWDAGTIVVQTVGRSDRQTLIDQATDARYVASGHLLFARGGALYAQRFDAATRTLSGAAVPVIEGVMRGTGTYGSGTLDLAVSDQGTLAYLPGPLTPIGASASMARFDLAGASQPLGLPPGSYQAPRLSPDGRRIAFIEDDGRDANVWVYGLDSDRAPRRLTFVGHNRSVAWSADSQSIAYRSDRDGAMAIYRQREDGTGAPERLTVPARQTWDVPLSFSPDGEWLLFDRVAGGRTTLWALSLRERRAARFGTVESSQLTGAVFAPDGKWVAYAARQIGRQNQVFVEPFPATGAKYLVSGTGEDAHHPVWAPDGTAIFYTPGPGTRITRVPVTLTPSVSFGAASVLPRPFANLAGSSDRPYDVARDGTHFLSVTDPIVSNKGLRSITVVTHWFEELNARVSAQR